MCPQLSINDCLSISQSQGLNSSQSNMLILQESCTDATGSLLVYSPIEIQDANVVMSGEDPSNIPLLPSGYAIVPDGRPGSGGASSSAAPPPGSIVTIAFQIVISSVPASPRIDNESIATVNNLITTTVQQLRAALNCAGP